MFAPAAPFDPPPLPLGETRVQAVELAREEGGLFAAGARADLEQDVLLVVGILGQEQHLDALLERRHRDRSHCGRVAQRA